MPSSQDAPLKTYLDHLARGELAYQFSPEAGRAVFYPRMLCPFTGSDRLEWRICKGLGTVYATTVVHPIEGKQFNEWKTSRRSRYASGSAYAFACISRAARSRRSLSLSPWRGRDGRAQARQRGDCWGG
jgi:glutathionyl-hydroquinone reductase